LESSPPGTIAGDILTTKAEGPTRQIIGGHAAQLSFFVDTKIDTSG
jgi:hypothetical protein